MRVTGRELGISSRAVVRGSANGLAIPRAGQRLAFRSVRRRRKPVDPGTLNRPDSGVNSKASRPDREDTEKA